MPGRIGDGLLDKSIQRRGQDAIDPWKLLGYLNINLKRVTHLICQLPHVLQRGGGRIVYRFRFPHGLEDAAHLSEGISRRVFNHSQRSCWRLRIRSSKRSPCLGLNSNGRHVVSNGVVKLAGELLALAQPNLLVGPPLGGALKSEEQPQR